MEAAIRSHAAVADAQVTGVEDPRGILGQVVKAEIVVEPGMSLDRDELLDHCAIHLELHKIPAVLELRQHSWRSAMPPRATCATPHRQ